MATSATILQIYCVKEATGTDFDHLRGELSSALSSLPPVVFGEFQPQNLVNSIVGLASAIDRARSDPDDLYVTTTTAAGMENAIWPTDGSTNPMQQGQSVFPNIVVPIPSFGVSISLWDYDSVSEDDLLASIAILEEESGTGPISKLGQSEIEGSAYYITYQVD